MELERSVRAEMSVSLQPLSGPRCVWTSAEFNMKKIDGIQSCAYYIPQAYIHEADEKRNVAYIV